MSKLLKLAIFALILVNSQRAFGLKCEASDECRNKLGKNPGYTYTCAATGGASGVCAQSEVEGAVFCCS